MKSIPPWILSALLVSTRKIRGKKALFGIAFYLLASTGARAQQGCDLSGLSLPFTVNFSISASGTASGTGGENFGTQFTVNESEQAAGTLTFTQQGTTINGYTVFYATSGTGTGSVNYSAQGSLVPMPGGNYNGYTQSQTISGSGLGFNSGSNTIPIGFVGAVTIFPSSCTPVFTTTAFIGPANETETVCQMLPYAFCETESFSSSIFPLPGALGGAGGIAGSLTPQGAGGKAPAGPAALTSWRDVDIRNLASFSQTGLACWSTTGSACSPPTQGSLTITSVKISQAPQFDDGSGYPDGKVPLVLNRNAVVQVMATSSGTVASSTNIPLQITVSGSAGETNSTSVSATVQALTYLPSPSSSSQAAPGAIFTIPITDIAADQVAVSVGGPLPSGVTATNSSKPALISVFKVPPTNYLYLNIQDGTDTASTTDFQTMISRNDSYLESALPLDPNTYTSAGQSYDPAAQHSLCAPLVLGFQTSANAADTLCNLDALADVMGIDKAIGLVSQHWMDKYVSARDPNGWSSPGFFQHAVIVQYQSPVGVAHELGHTYGLYAGTNFVSDLFASELYKQFPGGFCPLAGGGAKDVDALGYWLQWNQYLSQTVNYMCEDSWSPKPDPSYTVPPSPAEWTSPSDWITVGQKLTATRFDPEVIIVAGYADNQGNGGIGGLYRTVSGVADASLDPEGSYKLQILSSSGSVLSSISFTPNFTVTDVPDWNFPLCEFVLQLAYPSNAAAVRIVKGTSVLASENIGYGLLLTAVQNLQDEAFVTDPTERRNALVNKINAFDQQLASGNTNGAYQALTNDIAKQISSWLSDSYVAPNALFYTKASLLSLVDELAQRLTTTQ
jgi:hypothetical protein